MGIDRNRLGDSIDRLNIWIWILIASRTANTCSRCSFQAYGTCLGSWLTRFLSARSRRLWWQMWTQWTIHNSMVLCRTASRPESLPRMWAIITREVFHHGLRLENTLSKWRSRANVPPTTGGSTAKMADSLLPTAPLPLLAPITSPAAPLKAACRTYRPRW